MGSAQGRVWLCLESYCASMAEKAESGEGWESFLRDAPPPTGLAATLEGVSAFIARHPSKNFTLITVSCGASY